MKGKGENMERGDREQGEIGKGTWENDRKVERRKGRRQKRGGRRVK